jgi:Restriction endonuclease
VTSRGSEFETEVAKILRSAGFEVTPNAKAASPRQTDLFARSDSVDLLIEAKNRKHKIDVSDVDALRSRLNRTSFDVVGAIFTTSGITRGAVKLIESDRRREVLVFVKEEVERLRRGDQNVRTLIDRKRNELRVHGKAWFGPTLRSEFLTVRLPSENVEFQIGDAVAPYFESRSSLSGAYYSLEMPDPGWGGFGGEGARLSISLPLSTARDLRNIMGYLHERFGLSKNGIFSIHQSESC